MTEKEKSELPFQWKKLLKEVKAYSLLPTLYALLKGNNFLEVVTPDLACFCAVQSLPCLLRMVSPVMLFAQQYASSWLIVKVSAYHFILCGDGGRDSGQFLKVLNVLLIIKFT